MRGDDLQQCAMFSYVWPEERVPANHPLRPIRKLTDRVLEGLWATFDAMYLDWVGFCGGASPTAVWLTRNSIIEALKYVGFNEISIDFDLPDHPNGPSFAIAAQRQ